jgi:hypothetical protein
MASCSWNAWRTCSRPQAEAAARSWWRCSISIGSRTSTTCMAGTWATQCLRRSPPAFRLSERRHRGAHQRRLLRRCGFPVLKSRAGRWRRWRTEKLARWFGTPYRVAENEVGLSVRIGLALSPDHGGEADALFMYAESALQRAKTAGDRYLLYTPKMSERVAERLSLESQLRQAIERRAVRAALPAQGGSRQPAGGGLRSAHTAGAAPSSAWCPPCASSRCSRKPGMILEVGSWALRRAVLDQRLVGRRGRARAAHRGQRVADPAAPAQLRRTGPGGGRAGVRTEPESTWRSPKATSWRTSNPPSTS